MSMPSRERLQLTIQPSSRTVNRLHATWQTCESSKKIRYIRKGPSPRAIHSFASNLHVLQTSLILWALCPGIELNNQFWHVVSRLLPFIQFPSMNKVYWDAWRLYANPRTKNGLTITSAIYIIIIRASGPCTRRFRMSFYGSPLLLLRRILFSIPTFSWTCPKMPG